MEYQVIQMDPNTWRVEDHGVRFFLLSGTERALLIDSGMQVHNARDIASALTPLPLSLLNTHADIDHIGSNAQFEAAYLHPAEEAHYRSAGMPGAILPIADGDVLDLGGRELRIVHLPGHTAGSVAVLDVQNRALISGDPVQEHGRIFMFGAHRNMNDYICSLEKLKGMSGFDELWPSHADIPIKPDVIDRLLDGMHRIRNGEVHGRREAFHGRPITAYDLGFTTLLCDPEED